LANVQRAMPELGVPHENIVWVSGIGCSSRFPYYMNTYGFHTIHGRAAAVATGLKASRPDLSVWVATGDGDALSIGGNHTMHALRRNIDINILLFNNQIYGLTKGQYSPTSEVGKVTASTPMGSLDRPVWPLSLALGSNATFIARTIDREPKHMVDVLLRAAHHKGTSLVEVYQNCNIFNDKAFSHLTERTSKDAEQLRVEHGKPLLFDKGRKGIGFKNFQAVIIDVEKDGLDGVAIHDEQGPVAYHMAVAELRHPHFPTAIGVIRAVDGPVYDERMTAQIDLAVKKKGRGELKALLAGETTWRVHTTLDA